MPRPHKSEIQPKDIGYRTPFTTSEGVSGMADVLIPEEAEEEDVRRLGKKPSEKKSKNN